MEGYRLAGNTCESCPFGCEQCSTPAQCTTCSPRFVAVNGKCEMCSKSCVDCIDKPTSCTACAVGHFKSNINTSDKFDVCTPCIEDCRICNRNGQCLECIQKHTLSSDKRKCINSEETNFVIIVKTMKVLLSGAAISLTFLLICFYEVIIGMFQKCCSCGKKNNYTPLE